MLIKKWVENCVEDKQNKKEENELTFTADYTKN